MLFAPIDPPADGPAEWLRVQQECKVWAEARGLGLEKLKEIRRRSPEETKYLAQKVLLLRDLTKAGELARKSLLALEERYAATPEGIQNVGGRRFDVDAEKLEPHLYVSPDVMAELDQIYTNHYRSGGALALSCSFNIMGSSDTSADALSAYKEYLHEVQEKLTSLASNVESTITLTVDDARALGLKNAGSKLEPLFGPVHGRICLPLPTESMLEDLKECLEVDPSIIAEVFNSLP